MATCTPARHSRPGAALGQGAQLGFGAVGQERAAQNGYAQLGQVVRDEMPFGAVHDHRTDAEFPADTQRGKDIIGAVRVQVRRDLAVQQGQQRVILDLIVYAALDCAAFLQRASYSCAFLSVSRRMAAVAIRVTGVSSFSW